jgi:hypothetical protein
VPPAKISVDADDGYDLTPLAESLPAKPHAALNVPLPVESALPPKRKTIEQLVDEEYEASRRKRRVKPIDKKKGLIAFFLIHVLLLPLAYLLGAALFQWQPRRPAESTEQAQLAFFAYGFLTLSFLTDLCFLFQKVGIPWWQGLVPVLNGWRFCEVGGLPGWTSLVTIFCPCIPHVALYGIGRNFGLPWYASIFVIFWWPVVLPVLIFSDAEHGGDYFWSIS